MTDSLPGDYTVILAARMSSHRLPGKALKELAPGITVLEQIIRRWQASDRKPGLIVTTTLEPDDDPIAETARKCGIPVSRGHNTNVVAQMHKAVTGLAPNAKWVARALADNPLVDVALADWRLDVLAETGADGLWYGGATAKYIKWGDQLLDFKNYRWHEIGLKCGHDRSLPKPKIIWADDAESRVTYAGTTDVWSRAAWNTIVERSSGCQLEHPGLYYWDNIGAFKVVKLPPPRREYLMPFKTELDAPADLEMFRSVWAAWGEQFADAVDGPTPCVPTLWALKWLAAHPEAASINSDVKVKTQTRAIFEKDYPFICDCGKRNGSKRYADFTFFCPNCGRRNVFYKLPPNRR